MTPDQTLDPAALQFNPPCLPGSLLRRAVEAQYDTAGDLCSLEGEREQNHLLTATDGRQFVIKVSSATESRERIDMQTKVLQYLAGHAPHLRVPRVVPTRHGDFSTGIACPAGAHHTMRLLTYLPGPLYGEGPALCIDEISEIGRCAGSLSRALSGFTHTASHQFMPWDLTNGLLLSDVLWSYGDDDIRSRQSELRPVFERLFGEQLADLRHQVTHYDLGPMNLVRMHHQPRREIGIIDFSDMVGGPLICDIAILAWEFILYEAPIPSITAVVEGYHSRHPLTRSELCLLYKLVLARSVQMVLMTDLRLKTTHNRPVWTRDRSAFMARVRRWLELDEADVISELMAVCGHGQA